MKEISPALHLGVRAVPNLPPNGVRREGVGQPLGDDPLEVKPLKSSEEVTAPPLDAELRCVFVDRSADTDGSVVRWQWSFGDGASSSERNPSHL